MDQHAIIIADAGGVIQLWSAGAAALFGYQAADAVGKKLDLVVPPELRELTGTGSVMRWRAASRAARAHSSMRRPCAVAARSRPCADSFTCSATRTRWRSEPWRSSRRPDGASFKG